jgi:hypothetical protein
MLAKGGTDKTMAKGLNMVWQIILTVALMITSIALFYAARKLKNRE